jgi:group I intron endonuclease
VCDQHKLLELEQLILDEYSSFKEVFNVNKSCDSSRLGIKHTDETRAKISARRKGKPNLAARGRKRTPEQIENLRLAHLGKPSPIKGRIRPESDKIAIREALAKMPKEKKEAQVSVMAKKVKKYWEDNKEKHIQSRLKNKFQCKWIIQMDLEGNEIDRHHGVKYAADKLGINKNRISGCLKGRFKSSGMFTWKYAS